MMTRPCTSYAAFRYETDDCGSVKEYLEYSGIELPKLETRGTRREGYEYRYRRGLVVGEWHPTMKAAKASYKQALKASREQSLAERAHWQAIGNALNDSDYQVLRKAVGGYSAKRPQDWLGNNAFTTAMEGPDFEVATRLLGLGLMDDCGDWNGGKFFQVSPNGCRAIGIPEGRINKAHFF